MTITRNDCFCDNPECRATTPAASERFAKWETIAVEGVAHGIADAHLCERCSRLRTARRSLDFWILTCDRCGRTSEGRKEANWWGVRSGKGGISVCDECHEGDDFTYRLV